MHKNTLGFLLVSSFLYFELLHRVFYSLSVASYIFTGTVVVVVLCCLISKHYCYQSRLINVAFEIIKDESMSESDLHEWLGMCGFRIKYSKVKKIMNYLLKKKYPNLTLSYTWIRTHRGKERFFSVEYSLS